MSQSNGFTTCQRRRRPKQAARAKKTRGTLYRLLTAGIDQERQKRNKVEHHGRCRYPRAGNASLVGQEVHSGYDTQQHGSHEKNEGHVKKRMIRLYGDSQHSGEDNGSVSKYHGEYKTKKKSVDDDVVRKGHVG